MSGVKGKGGKKGFGRTRSHYRGPDGIQCCTCHDVKLLSEYTDGDQRTCKSCKRNGYFLRAYGITQSIFDRILEEQKGACAICCRRRATYVDHDHITKKVRGLLCPQCNTALGYLFDDIRVVRRALKYMEKNIIRI